MATAEAINVGPVARVSIPVPEGGGVVVFRGRNGAGKSTILNTIDAALSGQGTAPVRDGAIRGEFTGLGVRMTIGRSTRRSGEAEVHTLEGKLSIADLVDPGVIDPEKADAHRIKALVSLAGAKADPTIFYDLAGGKEAFEAIVQAGDLEGDDLIAMASRIKRRLEAAARSEESLADHAEGRAKAARDAAGDVDRDADVDGATLHTALEAAIREESQLLTQSKERAEVARKAERAREALEDAEAEYDGCTVTEVLDAFAKATEAVNAADEAVVKTEEAEREANRLLAQAYADRQLAKERQASADKSVKAAEAHENSISLWREQIEAAVNVQPISSDDLTVANARTKAAREALERGAVIRDAHAKAAQADQHQMEAADHRQRSERLRDAAKGTDDVLSQVVGQLGVPLRVEPIDQRMRLVTNTKARGRTCYGELSDGERWRIALDLAIKAVGEGGEITVPQAAWEGLDPKNRRAIAEQLADAGVLAFTAEADDGDLRAEVFEP